MGRDADRDDRGTRHAARTTIVGGQPPGNARPLCEVPEGLEELLSLAATDTAFARALLEKRDRVAAPAGVALTPAEQAILRATDGPALEAMIQRLRGHLPEPERRAFLERAGAALALISAGALAPGCGKKTTGQGARRQSPPPQNTTGARPDRPRTPPSVGETGARPDRPDAGAKKAKPPAAAPKPKKKVRLEEPPPHSSMGVRSDRVMSLPIKRPAMGKNALDDLFD